MHTLLDKRMSLGITLDIVIIIIITLRNPVGNRLNNNAAQLLTTVSLSFIRLLVW